MAIRDFTLWPNSDTEEFDNSQFDEPENSQNRAPGAWPKTPSPYATPTPTPPPSSSNSEQENETTTHENNFSKPK